MPSPSNENEALETRLKRLKFRAGHRGTKELDIILGTFANEYLSTFSLAELDNFESLLVEEETDLSGWLLGLNEYSDHPHAELLDRIRAAQLDRAQRENSSTNPAKSS